MRLYPQEVLDAMQGLIDEAKRRGITVRELIKLLDKEHQDKQEEKTNV